MSCPKCKHEIDTDHFPLGLVYCPYCGERINERQSCEVIPFCKSCGHRFLTEVVFCPECGKRTSSEPAPPPELIRLEPHPEPVHQHPVEPVVSEPPPEEEIKPEQSNRPALAGLKAAGLRVYRPLETVATGRWRLKRLYHEWAVHDNLPQEEIPADESLKGLAAASELKPETRPIPAWLAVVLGAGLLLLFAAVGLLLKRPA
jgi:DNA-directed RNA polymerase subunit RPC12/RpoP